MKRLIATAALATLVATPAFAQSYQYNPHEGPYIGAGFGQAKTGADLDLGDELRSEGFTVISTNTDDADVGFKVFAGYQFNPNFAIEASYLNFGDFESNAQTVVGDIPASIQGDISVEGFGFALVGKLPIQNGFSVYGKLGLIAWDADIDVRTDTLIGNISASDGEDGIDPFYGIGAEYVINQLILRAEIERYDLSEGGDDFEIDLISASIGYRF
ncbi:porin family protein [Halomonas sp. RA08-2]|uniref:porin family protein n=1 Tax=Halomonas sp. RA08-2 TaxID=3440842 RepID=UPI003EF000E4